MNVETVQQVAQEELQQVISSQEETISEQQASSSQETEVETSSSAPCEVQSEGAVEAKSEGAVEADQNVEQGQDSDDEKPQSEEQCEVETDKPVEVQEGEADLTEHYKEIIADAEKLYEELIDVSLWNADSNKDGIKGYLRQDAVSGLKMARGEGVINKSADTCARVVMDPACILKWEGNIISHQVVETVEDFEVIRSLDKKRAFVSQRETLLLTRVIRKEDGSIVIIQKSFSHSAFPEKKEFVRAHVNLCSWTLVPDQEDPNKTHGTYMIFVDPKGWVPKPVFNAFVSDQTTNIKKLRNYVQAL